MKTIKQENIISEISIKGNYQKLRVTRIQYEQEQTIYIDLRIMQYIEDEEGKASYAYTKKGFRVQERDFRKLLDDFQAC